jgi:hypothetical protein
MIDLDERGRQQCREAVLAELAAACASPDSTIDLYGIGQTLIAKGYTQKQIVGAIYMLAYDKRLEYVGGNRVRMIG